MVKAPIRTGRARIVLDITQVSQIKRRLEGSLNGQPTRAGFVCSESWSIYCIEAIEKGVVPPRKKMRGIERDLVNASVYPPGGSRSRMVETFFMRYVPPDITGSPIGEREDAMTYAESCKFARSSSAVELDRIRHAKAKPEKR